MSEHNLDFEGFTPATLDFLTQLKANNNRPWFEAHKQDYENNVLAPARSLVLALGAALRKLSPQVNADPRTDKSIFRIYRDTRFSPDKTPYKTNLALWFWVGQGAKLDHPGYYFHLEPPILMLGAGIHIFSDNLIKVYREAVVDETLGPRLETALRQVIQADLSIEGEHYKRVPRGYDPDHPRAGLLRHRGLTTGIELPIPDALFGAELVSFCIPHYQAMHPLVTWLHTMVGGDR